MSEIPILPTIVLEPASEPIPIESTVNEISTIVESTPFIDIMSQNPPVDQIQSQFLFSIDDLLNSQEVIEQQENEDRLKVQSFINPSYEQLKPIFLQWAKQGFPSVYPINTLKLNAPSICSDGQSRTFPVYIEYLLDKTIETWLQDLSSKSNGMLFTFSHSGGNTITLHVSRG